MSDNEIFCMSEFFKQKIQLSNLTAIKANSFFLSITLIQNNFTNAINYGVLAVEYYVTNPYYRGKFSPKLRFLS